MRIGVYVGSFNPVHVVHKNIMDYLINNSFVDKIIVIATGDYWDKSVVVSLDDRINMLKFLESKYIIVDNNLNNYEYTYEILDKLKKDYSMDEFYLIIGEDNLLKFHLWKNVNKILLNKVIVVKRDALNYEEVINNFVEKDNFIFVDMNNLVDVSSSIIREKIKKSESVSEYLDSSVLKYIVDNNLYK